MKKRRSMSDENPRLNTLLGILCVGLGAFFLWIGVSVLSADVNNMFAKVIMSASGKKSMTTTLIGLFFTVVGIYFVAWGLMVWIALLTHSPRLRRIVFRKKAR
jgi:hypothetical protein